MINSKKSSFGGFSLIEVLVAIIFVSIGVLGYAGLQMNGLKQTSAALFRSQATVSTHDIADRLRANLPGALAGGYRTIQTAGLSTPNCDDACIPFDLAVRDLKLWQNLLAQHLPLGVGEVSCTDSDTLDAIPCSENSTHTIVVSWDDNQDGNARATIQVDIDP
jgi:type IV pilus assembly protein PilV